MLIVSGLAALLFAWMFMHGVRNALRWDAFHVAYLAVLLLLAALFAWFPFDHWRFERRLTDLAVELSGRQSVEVNCSTVTSSVFDLPWLAGRAHSGTGEIYILYPTCPQLKDYAADPDHAGEPEVFALHVFVHEAMHVRGELNEQLTDCQAIQRSYRAARLFGAAEAVARRQGVMYFEGAYRRHDYYSSACRPGGPMDEQLADSSWHFLADGARAADCSSLEGRRGALVDSVLSLAKVRCE